MRKKMINYFNLVLVTIFLAGFGLLLPSAASAALPFATSDLILKEEASINCPVEFTVRINNAQTLPADPLSLKLSLPDAMADLQSLELMTNSGWKTVIVSAEGQNLMAAFSLTDSLSFAGERVYPFRAVFRNAKDYLIGFTLEAVRGGQNAVLSSTAQPLKVASSGTVLGASVFTFTRNLQTGSRGEEVSQLQLALARAGFYSGPVTGYFGKLTWEAVKAYQTSKSIAPLGMVGALTRQALNGM